jgi:hypothetical protein
MTLLNWSTSYQQFDIVNVANTASRAEHLPAAGDLAKALSTVRL